jgi:Sec-independent protein translocase protein TatA
MPELVVLLVVGILVFGSKFPEVIRQVSKMWFKLRRTVNDIKRETGLEQTLDELRRDADPFAPGGSGPSENNDAVNQEEDIQEAAVEFIKDDKKDSDEESPA